MKKIISLFLILIMIFAVSCANDKGKETARNHTVEYEKTSGGESSSKSLRLIKSDIKFTQEQVMSKIKAEYLIDNGGYNDDDLVRVMICLNSNSLIDDYKSSGSEFEKASDFLSSNSGKYGLTRIKTEQNRLVGYLQSNGLIENIENSLNTITNAIIADVKYKNISRINSLCEVESVILSDTFNKPLASEGDASAINNAVDIYETGIYDSSSVAYTGKGTSVAILDSGFDCSHKVFARQPDGEIAYTQQYIAELLGGMKSKEFTADLDVMDVYYSRKIPYTYDYADKDANVFPYDSEHGTHVAGIIGGYSEEDDFKGVAIDTQLVLMKVFPDLDSGADTDDILLALEDAVKLGVDAINMSLGSSCGFSTEADDDNLNKIYQSINDAGISLITAASNSYSSGFGGAQGNTNFVTNPDSGTVGSPSTYNAALSVASISGTKSRYLVANDSTVVFYKESNSINAKENKFYEELYAYLLDEGVVSEEGEEITLDYVTVPGTGSQQSYSSIDVNGKIALIKRGDNTFEEKAQLARRYGAIACIIYNNIDGDISMSMGKSTHIPTVSISKDSGTQLATQSQGKITISAKQQAGPFISDFSSWGPTPSLGIKPEITAHGGNIKSSIPGGGYDLLSGTSMASPNLCGITLLIRQYVKDEYGIDDWVDVMNLTNQLMMSTATIAKNEEGNPYSPRKQGAGLAMLSSSVNSKAYIGIDGIDRTKLELGDDKERKGVYEMTFNVVNLSGDEISYDVGVIGMTETVSKYDTEHVAETPFMLGGGYKTEFIEGEGLLSGNSVSVNAHGSVKLKVTYTLTDADKQYIEKLFPYGMYVEGFVTLKANYDGVDINCPFLAFYGDWTEAPMFDKTYFEVESEAHDASIDYDDKIKADYYATLPYGSYYYNYMIPLGTYLYDIDTTQYDYIPAQEEHIAVSNILGTIDGFSAVYAGLLRNAKEMRFTITDKVTGEVLWEYVDYNATKAYSYGGTPIPYYDYLKLRSSSIGERGLVNNRTYEFKMSGILDYGDGGVTTNKRNTFSFDFVLDDEAPLIKEVTYDKVYDKTLKKDRYYLNLTVYDNHYVMSVAPIIFSSAQSYTYLTENPIPVYGEKGKDTTVRIEITDYLEDIHNNVFVNGASEFPLYDSIAFSIEDYALNSNIYLCPLPGVQGEFKFTDSGETDGREIDVITVGVGEIVDLTKYLASFDKTLDEGKSYLKYLDWTSSNENVATVSEGMVKALAEGRVKITVSDVYSSSILEEDKTATVYLSIRETNTAEEVVTTTDKAVIEKLRISHFKTEFAYSRAGQTSKIGSTGSTMYTSSLSSISMYPGEKIKLYADLDPWYAKDKYELKFTSTNPETAKVEEDGTVTALKKGTVRITVGVGESSRLTDTITITVNSPFIIEDRTLVAYKGLGGTVEIPDDEGILYIGSYAFCLYDTDYSIELSDDDYDANKIPSANTQVTKVIIPEGVEEIRKYAFYNCSGLREVVIPESAKYIREYAFYGNESLESIDVKNVEVIGAKAFFNCAKLKSVGLNKVYAIDDAAFMGCSALEAVDLSALRNSGKELFYDCTSLKDVVFDLEGNTKLSVSMFQNTALESLTLYGRKSGLGAKLNFDVPDRCFLDCKKLKTVNLPDTDVTFGDLCFYGCEELEKVTFKHSTHIIDIEGSVFEKTSLKTFEVESGNDEYFVGEDDRLLLSADGKKIIFAAIYADYGDLTVSGEDYDEIGKSAFIGANITNLTIVGPIRISDYAFAKCESIKSVTFINGSEVTIGNHAFFYNRGLEEISGLEEAKAIGEYAFSYTTALSSANLGDSAEAGEGCFFYSGVESVEIGDNADIGLGGFQNCANLTVVRLGENVRFGMGAFMFDNKLASINLGGVSEISEQMFYRCSALTAIDLSSATKIGNYAFADCGTIEEVTLSSQLKSIGEGAFAGISENVYGGQFKNIDLPEGLEFIGDGAFLGCNKLTSVTIPSTVKTKSGEFGFVFYYCSSLKDVTLNNVDVLGDYCFAGCYALQNIDLSSVREIGECAFYISDDTQELFLENVDLSSAEKIGDGAFYGRRNLTGDIKADKLTEIGMSAFYNTDFTSFEAENLEKIGQSAFYGNASLTEFKLSEKLNKIAAMAFVKCDNITEFKTFNGETDCDVNDYVKLIGGVLYVVLPSGHLQLVAVPANYAYNGETVTELLVADDTYRIEDYAGNENKNVVKIVLPDSLKLIGNYAFYGYENLEAVEFKSFTAPALEDYYNSETKLGDEAAGSSLLHNQYDLFGFELYYYTFIDLVGEKEPIKMILPSNEGLEGYDSLVYEAYFGKIDNAERSDYEAMDKNLIKFIEYAEQLKKISKVTYGDEPLINKATLAYNATKQVATDYGYEEEVWVELVETYKKAKKDLFELKLAAASDEVRALQSDIYELPETFTIDKLGVLKEITARLNGLDPKDKLLLDLTAYSRLVASYNEYIEKINSEIYPIVDRMDKLFG